MNALFDPVLLWRVKVLVTGGTGVIGAGAIPELLRRGHTIRLLSRGADRAAGDYPERVEPFSGDVSDPNLLQGAAAGCDVVIHIAGIVEERPPDATFERVNIAGTRNILDEAARSGVARFIFVSSLGADTGTSEYHASKRRAEKMVQEFPGRWTILRPGNVYGPGDEVISLLLKMVRTMPVVPTVGAGDQQFQPIWFEDLGRAIAQVIEEPSLDGQILELAGSERTTTSHVLQQLSEITGRTPSHLPIPEWLARVGTALSGSAAGKLVEHAGLPVPLSSSKLTMLLEENFIQPPERNALIHVLKIEPTPLRDGLGALADKLPELLPEHGVGTLERKLYWIDIQGSRLSHTELLRHFRDHIREIMPIEFAAEPGTPAMATKGTTLTGAIPGRGNFQVRVEEEKDDHLTLATLEGHPIAGLVTFRTEPISVGVRFLIEIYARASNLLDWIALRAGGTAVQSQNWRQVASRVADLSGGTAPDGVQFKKEKLTDEQATRVERSAARLVQERKREEQSA